MINLGVLIGFHFHYFQFYLTMGVILWARLELVVGREMRRMWQKAQPLTWSGCRGAGSASQLGLLNISLPVIIPPFIISITIDQRYFWEYVIHKEALLNLKYVLWLLRRRFPGRRKTHCRNHQQAQRSWRLAIWIPGNPPRARIPRPNSQTPQYTILQNLLSLAWFDQIHYSELSASARALPGQDQEIRRRHRSLGKRAERERKDDREIAMGS